MAKMKPKGAQSATPIHEAPANDTPDTIRHVGDTLRQAREEQRMTIDMVADELMIRRFYLDALENGHFRDLPERVYAMGFVRNYALFLGLDPRALVEQFKRDAYGTRQGGNYRVELNMPEPVAHSVVPGRSAMVSAVLVLILLVGGVVWFSQDRQNVAGSSIPEPAPVHDAVIPEIPPVAEAPAPTGDVPDAPVASRDVFAATPPAATPPVDNAPAAPSAAGVESAEPVQAVAESAPVASVAGSDSSSVPAAIANVPNTRILEALQSSWVEVRDEKNTILFTNILKSGQILPLPDKVRLTVTTGNAGGLRLIVKGKAQPAFGAPNEVKRNIILDPQALDRY